MLLEGKVALIVGSATGLGKTGATLFAKEGAKVIVADINDEGGANTVAQIRRQGAEASFAHVDTGSVSDIEHMVKASIEFYGRFDILWYNVGVFSQGHIETITEDGYDEEMILGLKGAVFTTKYVIPFMKEAGKGSVLYTSSMVGLRPNPYQPRYSLTHGIEKAGIIMLMRNVTEPLAMHNIRVNCVCPGPVETERWRASKIAQAKAIGVDPEVYLKAAVDRIPLKRTIKDTEIARAAAFLVSDWASGITGVALPVDGGFTAL